MSRLLGVVLAVLMLTGCVGIPDDGPVTAGQIDVAAETDDLEFLAEEPDAGATQEEVVLGFLAAGISPSDDFSIARDYLTPAEALRWNPDAGVSVRSGQPEVSLQGETTAVAVIDRTSLLDTQGALHLTDDGHVLEFELARDAGEWRIARAPDGIVLSGYHFARLFRSHTLHWLTPDGTRSVPEVRWFERTVAELPGRIVDALLGGPSTWLAPAVTTAGAPGAYRVGEPVVVGALVTVRVAFTQVEQRGSASLQPLAAQLALSMGELNVREVRVEVDGLDDLGASSADAAPIDDGDVDPRPLVLEGTTLRPVGGGESAVDDVGPTLAAIDASGYTVGAAGGVANSGTVATRVVAGADPVVVTTDASAPATVDDSGWVLVQEQSAQQRLLAWRDGERVELPLPPGAPRLSALELSRDGARLAMTGVDGSTEDVWVSAVVRDTTGRPVSLGEPFPLQSVEGTLTDLSWISATELAVLTADEDESQVVVLEVGGQSEQLPAPGDTVRQVVGGSEGVSTLRALSDEGALLSLRGRVWSPTPGVAPITLIATQQ